MKPLVGKNSQSGFTLLEILAAAAVVVTVQALIYTIITHQQKDAAAEGHRLRAKMEARTASENLKLLFRKAKGVMSLNADATRNVFLGSDPLLDNYSFAENTCIAPPPGAQVTAPSYAALPDCPAACPAGQVPQIKITYKSAGVTVYRYFPTSFTGLHGAIVCARQFSTLLTFPVSLRAPDFSVMVYVGWKTFRSGTSADTLWTVDGTFLTGGEAQNVVMKKN
jgi:prepilin-type N-terminal cleavage/methylation domain-containing protein